MSPVVKKDFYQGGATKNGLGYHYESQGVIKIRSKEQQST